MSIKQDRTATRTSEDLRRRLNVGEIVETGKKVDASVETVQKLSNQVTNLSNQLTGLNDTVTNTRESYVSTNAQTFTDEQKTRARNNIGAGNSSFSGSYNDLSNKPTIPTKTSQLENDAGFVTDTGTIVPIDVKNEHDTSTKDPYSCDYINKLIESALNYKNGDTFKISSACYLNGQISASSTQILFSIVTPKLLTKIKSVTVNSYDISVRKVEGGYALNRVTSGLTISVVAQLDNLLRFIVTNPETIETTNNTPCGIAIYGLDLTFNE